MKSEILSRLAVDLVIRWIPTIVNSNNPKPKFYGLDASEDTISTGGSLALKSTYRAIKRLGHKERQVVNNILHKISRVIVNGALESCSMIRK